MGRREEAEADRFLDELQARWRGANSLQYRSVAFLSHSGEFELRVRVAVILRRPNLGRLRFDCVTWPEAARVRVGDGRFLYDRQQGQVGRKGHTRLLAYRDRLTGDLTHPLDEVAYFPDQFFAAQPFLPPRFWGNGEGAPKRELVRVPIAEAIPIARTTFADAKRADAVVKSWPKEAARLSFTSGTIADTLYFDPLSFAPLTLRRVGDHAGRIQELLRETFLDFALGTLPSLSDPFVWTVDDERGIVAPEKDTR